ncbi:sugar transferase [Rhodovulum sp. YNF3179]|uniref:sugar transferase n=1 Tax=Rhodovulum sp. YNF3179 TaxID=3425127 RepID=UPI003D351C81
MTRRDRILKRSFDVGVATVGLLLLWPVMLLAWWLAARDTGASGFFIQERVGLHGRIFQIVKLRTMRPVGGSTVTTANDMRITPLGRLFRKCKLDELPQLWNVLKGDMSLVGPRPDVPGFADRLSDADRLLLTVRPGITGPATLKYRNEEEILSSVEDPEDFSQSVIWPDKVRINCAYVQNWSFAEDLVLIWRTLRQ